MNDVPVYNVDEGNISCLHFNKKVSIDNVELTAGDEEIVRDFSNSERGEEKSVTLDSSPPMSPSRVPVIFERLYNTHTLVSDQKRKGTAPSHSAISGNFRKKESLDDQDGSPSKGESPKVKSTNRKIFNTSSRTRSSAVPTSLSSAFDRLHVSPTKVSKAKEDYRKQCRAEITKKLKRRGMERNGEYRTNYGTIAPSQANDMYYRGMLELVKKEIQIAKHDSNFQTKLNLDQITYYSKILKEREEQNEKKDTY